MQCVHPAHHPIRTGDSTKTYSPLHRCLRMPPVPAPLGPCLPQRCLQRTLVTPQAHSRANPAPLGLTLPICNPASQNQRVRLTTEMLCLQCRPSNAGLAVQATSYSWHSTQGTMPLFLNPPHPALTHNPAQEPTTSLSERCLQCRQSHTPGTQLQKLPCPSTPYPLLYIPGPQPSTEMPD